MSYDVAQKSVVSLTRGWSSTSQSLQRDKVKVKLKGGVCLQVALKLAGLTPHALYTIGLNVYGVDLQVPASMTQPTFASGLTSIDGVTNNRINSCILGTTTTNVMGGARFKTLLWLEPGTYDIQLWLATGQVERDQMLVVCYHTGARFGDCQRITICQAPYVPLSGSGLHVSHYETCPEVCGHLDNPGLAQDVAELVDYSVAQTTLDQAAIEDELAKMALRNKNILHVGVGNSRLAQRFAGRASLIDGLTVSQEEKAVADALGIENYRVYLVSKYSKSLILTVKNRYDFIIDNALASFACCKFHFYLMLDSFLWLMNPGGQILTDQGGMNWVVRDPRWKLSYDDLIGLEAKFPVTASKVSETVYALKSTWIRVA